jgi:hypothetical protein
MPAPRDTSPDIWSRQLAAFRAMSPEERVRLALDTSEEIKAFARAGIRMRRPDLDDSQVEAELRDILLRSSRTSDPSERALRP